jgi:hypothetical protein
VRFFRKYHKWFSLMATIFILFFAVSGIILNHRELLSGIDLNRKWLPENYRYRNWNLASVKGSLEAGPDSVLIYGNIGVWLTDRNYGTFRDFNTGFPSGIDNRKISSMAMDPAAGLYAGTLFGLYRLERSGWQRVELPVDESRIVKVISKGDSLMVLTRSHLLYATARDSYRNFGEIRVQAGTDSDGKEGLFRTFWVIHSGEIYGLAGKLIVDAIGIIFILLCITGLIYFFVPYRLRRISDPFRKSKLKQFNRLNLKWHNVVGSWTILLLLLNTTMGIFLRPPLLIPIANSRVQKIKYTKLDSPNPWSDRFRDLLYDDSLHRFLVATSEGIYYSDDDFRGKLQPFTIQPPVSVMGITVFEKRGPGKYLIGSFSGIFEWEPSAGRVTDYITKTGYVDTGRSGPPFGSVSVAGYLKTGNTSELVFDYANGVFPLSETNPLPPVPREIISNSPISLWNTSLEVHTGRIFEPILGPFYILVVPLVGLATLIILISGFFAWWLARRKKENRNWKLENGKWNREAEISYRKAI